ncbi:PIR protein [Plasmodium vivax]|nr:PIR protein [Plasmodium vivax]
MSQKNTVDSEVDDMVLTYDEYINLIDTFDRNKSYSSKEVNVEDILSKANITGNERTDYLNAFKILLKHIHQDGLFIEGDKPEACNYINYILYKEVEVDQAIKRSYDDKPISLFHKFLGAYGEKHGNQNRCISRIRSIKPQTYNRINALYKVYDKYKDIRLFNQDTVQYDCSKFRTFFHSYNSYMRDNESKSSKFNEILENIQKQANHAFSLYENESECNNIIIDLRSPRLFKDDPVEKPEIHDHLQMSETRLQSVDSIAQSETHGTTYTLQTDLTNGTPRSLPEQVNQGKDEVNSANVYHRANDIHRSTSRQETIVPPIREYEEETQTSSRYPNHLEHSYSSGTSFYPRQYRHVEEQALSKEVELPPSSVISTITSALKDVEPGPVLGVSGGMGALFLLFKYTPVGTFFRGGRVRARRIPSGFSGPFPGDFANFHEYEGGHIGYGPMGISSLAE